MKLGYELSHLALKDIDDIWNFTATQWSAKQANEYYKLIFKEIKVLCSNPHLGKAINEIKSDHRIWIVKSHMLVYKIELDLIFIDRILHQKMDLENEIDY